MTGGRGVALGVFWRPFWGIVAKFMQLSGMRSRAGGEKYRKHACGWPGCRGAVQARLVRVFLVVLELRSAGLALPRPGRFSCCAGGAAVS